MDGFRSLLDQSVRNDDDNDWSVHTIDYGSFKQTLRFFARRRSRIKAMLRQSKDGRLAEDVLTTIIGIGPKKPIPFVVPVGEIPPGEASDETPYMAMDSASEMEESVSSGMARRGPKRLQKRSVMRRVSNVERFELAGFLKAETDKAHMFYLSQWQRLSERLEQQLNHELGNEILELIAFCVINAVVTRQILIRFDAYARTYDGTPMLTYYMKRITKKSTSFRKILYHEEVTAIADSYSERMDPSPFVVSFNSQRNMFREILNSSHMAEKVASIGQGDGLTDSFISSLRDWLLLGAFEDSMGLEPAYLTMRGKSLTDEMNRLVEWRQKKQEILPPKTHTQKLTALQIYHLTLTLLSAFLYCLGYTLVEPSSTMYVNRLGAYDAMSGTLIGMMPLGALLFCIPFSMWTNKSYRQPFLMSCTLLILGNLLYSIADSFQDVRIALAGRFIAGMGAPKVLIRRYLADTTPLTLRTSVNALFGMVAAAGSAMGPAMAIILNRVEVVAGVPYIGLIYLNGLTLPGYFMACFWFTFGLIMFLTFDEPDRTGLEEQKRLESSGGLHAKLDRSSQSDNASHTSRSTHDDELRTIFSQESSGYESDGNKSYEVPTNLEDDSHSFTPMWLRRRIQEARKFMDLITLPVRLCLGLLFAKVFTIEVLASATSALSKNRYRWQVQQVGTLGFVNGCLVIPFSIFIGRLSISYQDHVLMKGLIAAGCFGMFLLIDLSDLLETPTRDYNKSHPLSVGPKRYILGYFISYISIQTFEGVIGSTLSKVIPTALASGTINSGLLATITDALARTCGDLFISMCGFIDLRQLMNLLFIPGFFIMLSCLVVIERYRDLLTV